MIINRSLVKEVLQTSGAVTIVMLIIFMVVRMVGFLREAADGDIPVESVLTLLVLKLATYVDVILPLMLYVAVLMVLARWNRDNEMTVISASGIGLVNFLKPLAWLVLIVGSLVALFSMYISPLSVRVAEQVEAEFKTRHDITGVIPGVFMETQRGSGVYFVERYDKEADVYRDVFVYNSSFDREGVVVADTAHQEIDATTNDRFLVLHDGTRYEGNPGVPDYRIVDFETYAIRIEDRPQVTAAIPVKGIRTTVLLKAGSPRMMTEWNWRLSKPLMLPVLMLFALALSSIDIRRSRLPNLMIAFIVYFAYSNLLGFAVASMKKRAEDPGMTMWVIHAAFGLLGLYLFYRRSRNLPFLPSVRAMFAPGHAGA